MCLPSCMSYMGKSRYQRFGHVSTWFFYLFSYFLLSLHIIFLFILFFLLYIVASDRSFHLSGWSKWTRDHKRNSWANRLETCIGQSWIRWLIVFVQFFPYYDNLEQQFQQQQQKYAREILKHNSKTAYSEMTRYLSLVSWNNRKYEEGKKINKINRAHNFKQQTHIHTHTTSNNINYKCESKSRDVRKRKNDLIVKDPKKPHFIV